MKIVDIPHDTLAPLDTSPLNLPLLNSTFGEKLQERLGRVSADMDFPGDLWPSDEVVARLERGETLSAEALAQGGLRIIYPWDLLHLNEFLVALLESNRIEGEISPRATIEGCIRLGENSCILPGVYIEGNVVIGRNCKIGPNCYLRGSTAIGDNCHVGQAVEIKNSLLGRKVSVGHLSYVGDSVIAAGTNFGAGTITANLRHDGKNHRSMVDGVLVETGRRKFGAIIGSNVHTGIHTSIYPGRKISAGASTRPGEIVAEDC